MNIEAPTLHIRDRYAKEIFRFHISYNSTPCFKLNKGKIKSNRFRKEKSK